MRSDRAASFMIDGVKVKPLRCIEDQRGFLMEMLRRDDDLFMQFGQAYLTCCLPDVAKAWHYHRVQTDQFVCIAGMALVVLYDLRDSSPSRGELNEFVLAAPPSSDPQPILLRIPPGVLHGFTALQSCEARVLNIPTHPYRYSEPDEYRIAWNSPDVPYQWPEPIKVGG